MTATMSRMCIFIEERSNAAVEEVVNKSLEMLQGKRIGLTPRLQHVHKLPEAVRYYTPMTKFAG